MGVTLLPQEHVCSPDYWRERMLRFLAKQPDLHQIIWQTDRELWQHTQAETAKVLAEHLRGGETVLDVGCGYGALVECLEQSRFLSGKRRGNYVGVDISPDLLDLARILYPTEKFILANASRMPLPAGTVDLAVLRQVKGTIRGNYGHGTWNLIRDEIARVSRRILYIGCPKSVNDPCEVDLEVV